MGKSWNGRERRRKRRGHYRKPDFLPRHGGIEKDSSREKVPQGKSEKLPDYFPDKPAPADTKCAVCEANEISGRLRLNSSDFKTQELLDQHEEAENLQKNYQNRGGWKAYNYEASHEEAKELRSELVAYSKDPQNSAILHNPELKAIREIVNSGERKFVFQPQFYLRETKGELKLVGQFITLEMTIDISFFKIPFLLGLETGKWYRLAACKDHLLELQYLLLETKQFQRKDRETGKVLCDPRTNQPVPIFALMALPALTYEDAGRRIQEIQKKNQEVKEKRWALLRRPTPEIINPEEETKVSQSFFPIVFDVFDEKTDRAVSDPGLNSSEILDLALENFRQLPPEKIGEIKILLGQKRSNGKMPAHLGFPGGSQDPDEEPSDSDLNLDTHLPHALKEMAKTHPVLEHIFRRTLEEFLDRTGFRPRKLYGRIIRLPKNETHVDQCLLMSAESNQSQPIRKIQKMDANQARHWFTLNEIYGETAWHVSHNHKRILLAIFELHQLPMPKVMKEFQEKLK